MFSAAAVGNAAEENIEIGYPITHSAAEISVAHGQLVKIAEHGKVESCAVIHGILPPYLCLDTCHVLIRYYNTLVTDCKGGFIYDPHGGMPSPAI